MSELPVVLQYLFASEHLKILKQGLCPQAETNDCCSVDDTEPHDARHLMITCRCALVLGERKALSMQQLCCQMRPTRPGNDD